MKETMIDFSISCLVFKMATFEKQVLERILYKCTENPDLSIREVANKTWICLNPLFKMSLICFRNVWRWRERTREREKRRSNKKIGRAELVMVRKGKRIHMGNPNLFIWTVVRRIVMQIYQKKCQQKRYWPLFKSQKEKPLFWPICHHAIMLNCDRVVPSKSNKHCTKNLKPAKLPETTSNREILGSDEADFFWEESKNQRCQTLPKILTKTATSCLKSLYKTQWTELSTKFDKFMKIKK